MMSVCPSVCLSVRLSTFWLTYAFKFGICFAIRPCRLQWFLVAHEQNAKVHFCDNASLTDLGGGGVAGSLLPWVRKFYPQKGHFRPFLGLQLPFRIEWWTKVVVRGCSPPPSKISRAAYVGCPSSIHLSLLVIYFSHFRLGTSLQPLNGIHWNFTGSKISTYSTKLVGLLEGLPSLWGFGGGVENRWPPWPLIGWDIFDFLSATVARNLTKLNKKQDIRVLYQVRVFWPIRKARWPSWPLFCWYIFDFSSAV